ncbi:hypothetical protein BCR44DRAFT_1281513 [Catenaria anguillulae PL171]|uniref:JmjC domain-containing protein n=1 Tax=Catenaria anguillulae PL171 TaxID=765915 RepID=A0A1Y2HVX6_9FUNG|nr:hypothetical protein BCR44DRAFT_1281513 [Catenaria anguillulae PL171]
MPTFAPDVWAEYRDLDQLIAKHGHAQVRFGTVPYADYFGLETGVTTLADFYTKHVKNAAHSDRPPQYVFQKHSDLTLSLLPVLEHLALTHFPRLAHDGGRLICPPSFAGTGNASIHYFVGAPGSGAPFHIHADAVTSISLAQRCGMWRRRSMHPTRASPYTSRGTHASGQCLDVHATGRGFDLRAI